MLTPSTFAVQVIFRLSPMASFRHELAHGAPGAVQSRLVICTSPHFPRLAAAAQEQPDGPLRLLIGITGEPSYSYPRWSGEMQTQFTFDSFPSEEELMKLVTASPEKEARFSEMAKMVIEAHEQGIRDDMAGEKPHPLFDMGAFNAVAHEAPETSSGAYEESLKGLSGPSSAGDT